MVILSHDIKRADEGFVDFWNVGEVDDLLW